LPESQLDRFLMRIELGYPDPEAERELMRGRDRRELAEALEPSMTPAQLADAQAAVRDVHASEALLDYVLRLVHYSRSSSAFAWGLSPRAGLALLRAAQAWAFLGGRGHVLPEDVQAVVPAVVEHRLREASDHGGTGGGAVARRLLATVDAVG
jgi:MoxR-like ATPase